jgi:transcriptional regulator with XRE-family HTH domain
LNALQELIRERMVERGWSYGDLAKRSTLPRSTIHYLATSERAGRRPPEPRTLKRLADGLDVSLDEVRAAAAAAAGLSVWREPADDPEIDVLVAALGRLDPAQRRHVAALVRSLLDGEERP